MTNGEMYKARLTDDEVADLVWSTGCKLCPIKRCSLKERTTSCAIQVWDFFHEEAREDDDRVDW